MAELGIRLVGSLALVVGLMLLIARGVNKRFKAPAGAAIQVVHRQALGRGAGVAVVSVGTRVLVLGTTEQQVTLLAEVEPDEVGLDLTVDPAYDALGLAEPVEITPQTEDDARPEKVAARTASSLVRRVVPLSGPLASPAAGPLAGSVLSPATWKQTLAAVTGQKAS